MIAKDVSIARAQDDNDYRSAIETAIHFFYGRQADRDFYDPTHKLLPDTWARLEAMLGGLNITAMIGNKLGGSVYDVQPKRELAGLDGKDFPDAEMLKKVETLWAEDELYTEMDQFASLDSILGQMFVTAMFDEEADQPQFMVYTPDQVRLFQDPVFPQRPDAYAMTWSDSQTIGQVNTYTKIMTRDSWRVVKGDMLAPRLLDYEAIAVPGSTDLWSGVNPIAPEIPVVHLKYMAELGAGSAHGVGLFHEVVSMNMILNMLLTTLRVLVKDQSLATLVVKNMEDTSKLRIGLSNTIIALRDTLVSKTGEGVLAADAQYITPASNIDKLIAAVQVDLGAMFSRFGMRNKNPLRIDISTPESGIAKWIEEADVRKQQRKQIPRLIRAEKNMLHYWMVADYIGRGKPLPDWLKNRKYTYRIDFHDREMFMSPQEKQIQDEWQKTLGIKDDIDLVMEYNPDIKTEDDAIAHIIRRKERALELQKQIAALSPAPAARPEGFNRLV